MLPTLQAVERGVGLQADAANRRVELFQAARYADKRSAGAQAGDKMGDAPAGLLPDFVGGGLVVRAPVCRIGVLVGIEILSGLAGVDFARAADGAVRTLVRRGNHQLDAVRLKDPLAFLRGVFRQ